MKLNEFIKKGIMVVFMIFVCVAATGRQNYCHHASISHNCHPSQGDSKEITTIASPKQECATVVYMVMKYLLIVLGLLISLSVIPQQRENNPTAK